MRIILGNEYITDKEASKRYGFSQDWFIQNRYRGNGPSYIKIQGSVLYPLKETDKWFLEKMENTNE